MSILKLKPSCKDYLWGGHRLAEEYGVEYDGDILAEAWELSCHPDGPSYITNGKYAGKTLEEFIEAEGKEVLGTHCRRFRDFPILTKFIDAKQNLSIQVHPNNRYALKNEGQYGKTEMWYIMDAEPGAFLYYGFKEEISKEEFAKRIEEDTLLDVLNAVPVQKGDVLFIESGLEAPSFAAATARFAGAPPGFAAYSATPDAESPVCVRSISASPMAVISNMVSILPKWICLHYTAGRPN